MGDYANIGAYITAPQKGWSGPAAVGVCMMSDEAAGKASHAPSTSFTVDLHKWKTVMGAYRDGGHMYHATMPTDAIKVFRDVVHETEKFGLKEAEKATWDLGMGVRKVLKDKGYTSVAAEGWEAPHVPRDDADGCYQNLQRCCRRRLCEQRSHVRGPLQERAVPDRGRRAARPRRAGTLQLVPHRPVRAGQAHARRQDDPQLRGRARRGHGGDGRVGPLPVHKLG